MLRGGFSANQMSASITPSIFQRYPLSIRSVPNAPRAAALAFFSPERVLRSAARFSAFCRMSAPIFSARISSGNRPLRLDIRSEIVRSRRGSGYSVEPAYRLSQLPFWRNQMRRTQLTARMQQFFTGELPGDDLPEVNTQQFEFGVNYYLRDDFRVTSSYGRQFSSEGTFIQGWSPEAYGGAD